MSRATVRSMTGFGSSTFEVDGRRYRIDIKTVNHRHLNMRFRVPGELASGEARAKKLAHDRLGRGAVEIGIALEGATEQPIEIEIDEAGARALGAKLNTLAVELNLAPPSIDLVVRLGDFVSIQRARSKPEALLEAMCAGLGEALDRVVEMREREGAALAADLLARLGRLDELLDRVEAEAPVVQKAFAARLRTRLDDAAKRHGVDIDPGRLATELVLFADRSDVTEETVRARTHIGAVRELLADGGRDDGRGKRLDFLAQELGREFNTIGSKCRDADMAGAVVDAKVELERIREQVQNIA